jgi:hypothetical protein
MAASSGWEGDLEGLHYGDVDILNSTPGNTTFDESWNTDPVVNSVVSDEEQEIEPQVLESDSPSGWQVLFQLGSPTLGFPSSSYTQLGQALAQADSDISCPSGGYCSANKACSAVSATDNIYVTLNGMDYTIPVNSTFYETTSSGKEGQGSLVCVLQIQDIGSTVNYFIAGDTFFKLYYGAFNTAENSMGISVNHLASGGSISKTRFGSGANVGLIVGLVCGALVLVLAIGLGIYCYKKKSKENNMKASIIAYTSHGQEQQTPLV